MTPLKVRDELTGEEYRPRKTDAEIGLKYGFGGEPSLGQQSADALLGGSQPTTLEENL